MNKNKPPKQKDFTWADMKRMVNRMPPELLKLKVYIWPNDEETALVVTGIERLKEDYVHDGDVGCCPKSIIKSGDPIVWEENKDEYYLVHPKGTRIINAE
jgi:hypothetical protein